ncbi:DUF2508 domain-containing protein [Cohnella candidum]|uniref:DUF2508 domain-containing protein n=1 Tax=Cohnella candidum TaxID=2674991 RepID=UPI001F1509D8|nr:DUF2508 domain-containing protein [Cohnella candidum]
MRLKEKNQWRVVHTQDRWEVIDDVRQAERELNTALWRFHEALGQDHVDYAIYSLEAAEKKLDMLLRKAKGLWNLTSREEESRGKIG